MIKTFDHKTVTHEWIKILETFGQQTISIIAKQKLISRQSMDPTSFIIYEPRASIIWDDNPDPSPIIKRDYLTEGEWGSVFYCYVTETVTPHSTGWTLNLKAFWSRSRDFAPFPNKAMKATKKLLTNADYLHSVAGTRLTNKNKKTRRGRNYRSRIRTLQEGLTSWASQFDEHTVYLKSAIHSEEGKKRPKSSAFIVIEPSHLFSDIYVSKRLWFIQTTVSYNSEGC